MPCKEKNYDFKKKLLKVHKEGRRDYSEKPAASELEITSRFYVIIPHNAGDVILTAAKDFTDYLFTSMDISAMLIKENHLAQKPCNSITLFINSELEEVSEYMGYRIETDCSIRIYGYDERGVAQALYYLEDVMNIRKAPYIEKGVIKRKPLFSPRKIQSGYSMEVFPNEHLSAMAHAGMDAIVIWIKGVNITLTGYSDFNELIYRAGKYGIDVYAQSYMRSEKHPDDEGAQAFYDNLYGTLFEKCPGLKGVILVGEAAEFPSKDKNVGIAPYYENNIDGIPTGKPSPGWWPCYDYPRWIDMIKTAVRKKKSDAVIELCTYNWGWAPEEDRINLIHSLPTDIDILVTFEMFEQYKLGVVTEYCADYTLAFPGPGKYFESEPVAAKNRGIKLHAISNTAGRTWDFGVVPYEPMPYQWIKRYKNIIKAHNDWNLRGLVESIHYGFWPSFISELEKWAFFSPSPPLEEVLKAILIRDYGERNFSIIDTALKLWSEAITHYVPTNEDQYGAFRIGPSFPFWLVGEIKPKTASYATFGDEIFFGRYAAENGKFSSFSSIRIHEEIASLTKMLDLLKEGIDILEAIEDKDDNEDLLYLLNLGKFIYRTTITGLNAKKFYVLKCSLQVERNREQIKKLISDIELLLKEELENAQNSIPLVEMDSRLGWEPSMEYTTDAEHIRWKIRQVEYELEYGIPIYRKGCEF